MKWIALVAIALLCAGTALAQAVSFQKAPTLAPEGELAQAQGTLARIDAARGTVRRQLETARAARDVIRTLCLNDKLNQIDVIARTAADRVEGLRAAIARADVELSHHNFAIVAILRGRVEQIGAEAAQCIGEEMAFIGQTAVVATEPPGLPPETALFPPIDTLPPDLGAPPPSSTPGASP
jgi:hypothetical protein